jgi:hypothetical protein
MLAEGRGQRKGSALAWYSWLAKAVEGGKRRAGVVGALLTYCKGPGMGNSVLANLLSLWQSRSCREMRVARRQLALMMTKE